MVSRNAAKVKQWKEWVKNCYVMMDLHVHIHRTVALLLTGIIYRLWDTRVWIPKMIDGSIHRLNTVLWRSDEQYRVIYDTLPYFDSDMLDYYHNRASDIMSTEREFQTLLYDLACIVPNCVGWDGRYIQIIQTPDYRRVFALE